ncbi:MAG TPA: hypothetical protein VH325_13470 [Bryobacteraceae bacterium]|jgi:hypothetical protein|nr:hypothetical protein [Bryobacteraceae bacterium]
MGIVLDSGVLIATEREAKPVSELLAAIEKEYGEIEVLLSSITVLELEHELYAPTKPSWRKGGGITSTPSCRNSC